MLITEGLKICCQISGLLSETLGGTPANVVIGEVATEDTSVSSRGRAPLLPSPAGGMLR